MWAVKVAHVTLSGFSAPYLKRNFSSNAIENGSQLHVNIGTLAAITTEYMYVVK
jgi:hypothetical protein